MLWNAELRRAATSEVEAIKRTARSFSGRRQAGTGWPAASAARPLFSQCAAAPLRSRSGVQKCSTRESRASCATGCEGCRSAGCGPGLAALAPFWPPAAAPSPRRRRVPAGPSATRVRLPPSALVAAFVPRSGSPPNAVARRVRWQDHCLLARMPHSSTLAASASPRCADSGWRCSKCRRRVASRLPACSRGESNLIAKSRRVGHVVKRKLSRRRRRLAGGRERVADCNENSPDLLCIM